MLEIYVTEVTRFRRRAELRKIMPVVGNLIMRILFSQIAQTLELQKGFLRGFGKEDTES